MPSVAISANFITTAVPSVSATGLVMWVGGGQSTTAFPVVVTGTVTAGAGTTVVSLTGSALVSGAVSISAMPSVAFSANFVTTAIPSASATGVVIWVGGGQSTTAFPVVVTGTVTAGAGTTVVSLTGSALVSGAVSISAMPAVSISVSAVLGTVVTLLGTVAVSEAGKIATQPTATSTGMGVWLIGGQTAEVACANVQALWEVSLRKAGVLT